MDHLFDLDMALAPQDLRPAAGVEVATTEEQPLPLRRTVEITTMDAFVGDSCAVCMDQFMPTKGGKRVPCDHVFYETCLMTWLSLHQSCPLCRFQVAAAASAGCR